MIDLYYWTSANAQKVLMFLEEAGLAYTIVPVNVGNGEQFSAEFVKLFPNSKIPAIVDRDPTGGGAAMSVFESGAILVYLAEKTGRFLATDARTRIATLQWLFWQVGGLGPMGGQAVHFRNFAPEPIEYAIKRYGDETLRLVSVLDHQLEHSDFVVGDYSIVDMACYPWIVAHERRQQLDLGPFPRVRRWFEAIRERPATIRAYAQIAKVISGPLPQGWTDMTAQQRSILFGSGAVRSNNPA